MKPIFRIKSNEKDITDTIAKYFKSITIDDENGYLSDRVSLVLADNGKIEIPEKRSILTIAIGYKSRLINFGKFLITSITGNGLTLTISATSAHFKSSLTCRREKSWRLITLDKIIAQIAAQNDLKPAISKVFYSIRIDQRNQTSESDLNYLTKLARDYGASFKIQDGKLIFIEKNKGKTATGQNLPIVEISEIVGNYSFSISDRGGYTGVRAFWQDIPGGERKHILVGESENIFDVKQASRNKIEAQGKAQSKFDELQSQSKSLSLSITGNPKLITGQKARIYGIRSGLDGLWIIEKTNHSITPTKGYLTKINLLSIGNSK